MFLERHHGTGGIMIKRELPSDLSAYEIQHLRELPAELGRIARLLDRSKQFDARAKSFVLALLQPNVTRSVSALPLDAICLEVSDEAVPDDGDEDWAGNLPEGFRRIQGAETEPELTVRDLVVTGSKPPLQWAFTLLQHDRGRTDWLSAYLKEILENLALVLKPSRREYLTSQGVPIPEQNELLASLPEEATPELVGRRLTELADELNLIFSEMGGLNPNLERSHPETLSADKKETEALPASDHHAAIGVRSNGELSRRSELQEVLTKQQFKIVDFLLSHPKNAADWTDLPRETWANGVVPVRDTAEQAIKRLQRKLSEMYSKFGLIVSIKKDVVRLEDIQGDKS